MSSLDVLIQGRLVMKPILICQGSEDHRGEMFATCLPANYPHEFANARTTVASQIDGATFVIMEGHERFSGVVCATWCVEDPNTRHRSSHVFGGFTQAALAMSFGLPTLIVTIPFEVMPELQARAQAMNLFICEHVKLMTMTSDKLINFLSLRGFPKPE